MPTGQISVATKLPFTKTVLTQKSKWVNPFVVKLFLATLASLIIMPRIPAIQRQALKSQKAQILIEMKILVKELAKTVPGTAKDLQLLAEHCSLIEQLEKIDRKLEPVGRIDREKSATGSGYSLRFAYQDENGKKHRMYLPRRLELHIQQMLDNGDSLAQILEVIEGQKIKCECK